MHVSGVHPLFLVILLGAISLAVKSRSVFAEGKAPCFAVCALVCDLSRRVECVPAFACESERGPFVGEVENWDEKRLGIKFMEAVSPDFSLLLVLRVHREPGNVCI